MVGYGRIRIFVEAMCLQVATLPVAWNELTGLEGPRTKQDTSQHESREYREGAKAARQTMRAVTDVRMVMGPPEVRELGYRSTDTERISIGPTGPSRGFDGRLGVQIRDNERDNERSCGSMTIPDRLDVSSAQRR